MILVSVLHSQVSFFFRFKPAYHVSFSTWQNKITYESVGNRIENLQESGLGNINLREFKFSLVDFDFNLDVIKYKSFLFGLSLMKSSTEFGGSYRYESLKKNSNLSTVSIGSSLQGIHTIQYGFYVTKILKEGERTHNSLSFSFLLAKQNTNHGNFDFGLAQLSDGFFEDEIHFDTTINKKNGFLLQLRYDKVFLNKKKKEFIGFYIAYQQGFRIMGRADYFYKHYDLNNILDQELNTRSITKGSGFYIGLTVPILLYKNKNEKN